MTTEEQTKDECPDKDWDVLEDVILALKGLSREDRRRVLLAACAFFEVGR